MTTPDPVATSAAHETIALRAADFCQRRHFWQWSDADQAELDAWLAESFLHRAAWLRFEGTAARTDQLVALRPAKPEAPAPREEQKAKRNWFVLPLLAAASVALIAALVFPFIHVFTQPPTDHTYATDVGGRTLLTFGDKTQVELNTNTVARFRMTTTERIVWLEKGEAWFHVTHNAANPFSVVVGKHRVTDLGTEFLVRRAADGLDVALLTGRAALSTEGAPTATLKPGDEAVATPVFVSIVRKTPQELAGELAWRQGMLVFRNARLADVVAEFNRYNTTKLVIADPTIAGETITADLKTDDFEAFLNLAQSTLNLHVERAGNEILISRGPREKTKRAVRIKHG